jgi:thiosulfate dehydrogenase
MSIAEERLMKRIVISLCLLIAAATTPLAQMGKGMHDLTPIEYSQQQFTEDMHISRGGQLYDNWWKATVDTNKPEGDHPLWKTQSSNKRSGYSTFRCKECHGWDYRGKDGAYRKGSHYTGFSGVYLASRTMSIKELESALRGSTNRDHDFSVYLGDMDIADLALFMKKGIIDLTAFINIDGTTAGGNPQTGSNVFKNNCTHTCHGHNGTAINFGDDEKPEVVSTVANKNPWEFIHKVRAGQPGTRMMSAIIYKWSDNDILDLLSYARTLPKDVPEAGWFTRMMRRIGFGAGHHEGFIPENSRGFGPVM